jgi:hypothetical protein
LNDSKSGKSTHSNSGISKPGDEDDKKLMDRLKDKVMEILKIKDVPEIENNEEDFSLDTIVYSSGISEAEDSDFKTNKEAFLTFTEKQ